MSDFNRSSGQIVALNATSTRTVWTMRILRVALFIALTAISARIKILLPGNPVPITAQTFVVLAAGLILGVREGAASQIGYLLLIAGGLPIDTNNVGAAVFALPSAGYLYGFVIGAGLAGLGMNRRLPIRIGAAFLGAAAIHIFGAAWLTIYLHSVDKINKGWVANLDQAWIIDRQFIAVDFGKALLAAVGLYAVANGWRAWLATRGNHAR